MLLLAVQFTYGFVFSTFLLLPKYLATVHRAEPDVIGQMSGAAMFAAVAAVPLVSWLLGRVGRGGLIVTGALLGTATAVGFAFLDAVGLAMLVLRLLQGVALVLVINASGTLVADCVPKARLGQALGLWGLALLITNAIAPALLEPVADHHGWDAVFYVAAAAGVIAAGLGAVVSASAPCREGSAIKTGAPVFNPRRLFLFGVTALMGTGLGTMFTFAQPFALHLGIDRVSGLFLGYTIGAVGARVGLGGLADRFGRAPVSAVALVVYAASVLATAWLSYELLFIVGAGVGLAHGISYPAMNALAVADATERQRGAVMAYYNGAFNVGFAISVTAFGELARAAGYPVVFLVAGGLVLIGAGALVRLPAATLRPRAELD
jgi:MFS family permease